jgi:hypothetical protein
VLAVVANQAVLAAVARRLKEDPDRVLPTLRLLADPDALPDRVERPVVELAHKVNAGRLQELLEDFRANSYTTSEVRELLGGVTRQAVASRVSSGTLLSHEIAGRSYFPDWQFGPDGPHRGLSELLHALVDGRGALAADALARRALPEEKGRSVADLLAGGRLEDALHYVATAAA